MVDDTQNNIKTLNTGLTSCGLQASRMKCNIQPCKLNLFQTEVIFLAEAPGGRQDLSFLEQVLSRPKLKSIIKHTYKNSLKCETF